MRVRWSESWSVSCARTATAAGTAERAPATQRARRSEGLVRSRAALRRTGERSHRAWALSHSPGSGFEVSVFAADFASKPAASPHFPAAARSARPDRAAFNFSTAPFRTIGGPCHSSPRPPPAGAAPRRAASDRALLPRRPAEPHRPGPGLGASASAPRARGRASAPPWAGRASGQKCQMAWEVKRILAQSAVMRRRGAPSDRGRRVPLAWEVKLAAPFAHLNGLLFTWS
jgi:hypothetical protein